MSAEGLELGREICPCCFRLVDPHIAVGGDLEICTGTFCDEDCKNAFEAAVSAETRSISVI